jgi:endonuclease/exonuclease/phosphatase family metal-dependent hydrolase
VSLVALSLNCWKNDGDWPARLARLAAALAREGPAIACLQEVYADRTVCAARTLAEASGLRLVHHPAREKDRGAGPSTSGLATLSAFPILGAEALALPSSPQDGGRFAQSVDVETPFGRLRVLNLHLTHLRGAEALRAAQLEAALGWARAGWQGPILVAGDFNARADDPALAGLFGAPDVIQAAPLGASTSLLGRPGALIDHVALLQAPGLSLSSTLALHGDDAVSDHAAVRALIAAAPGRWSGSDHPAGAVMPGRQG